MAYPSTRIIPVSGEVESRGVSVLRNGERFFWRCLMNGSNTWFWSSVAVLLWKTSSAGGWEETVPCAPWSEICGKGQRLNPMAMCIRATITSFLNSCGKYSMRSRYRRWRFHPLSNLEPAKQKVIAKAVPNLCEFKFACHGECPKTEFSKVVMVKPD